jgi:DNA processing protein
MLGEPRGMSMQEDLPYWITLNQRPYYFTAAVVERAVNKLSSLKGFFSVDNKTLYTLGFSDKIIAELTKIKNDDSQNDSMKLAHILEERGINIITYLSSEYPSQLRTIPNPPLLLFHKGINLNVDNYVAIVGTRDASFQGRSMARKLAKRLAESGYIITSGLARGIDIEAHCGALEAKGGKTVAVLAWFDPIYPPEHSEVVKEIENRGARVSDNYGKDFGTMTPVKFVERNRITSGLSQYVIIVETGEDGGTVRQAELANAQGKPVFVYLPSNNTRASKGFNTVVEKLKGIVFKDEDELMQQLKTKKINPPKRLDEFAESNQLKLE